MNEMKADNPMTRPFYKNWKFYILALATTLAILVVLVNIMTKGLNEIAGSIFWLLLAILFYYACSQVINGIPKSKNPLVNVALVFAILANTLLIFGLLTALFTR